MPGPPKLYPTQITVRLPDDIREQLDHLRGKRSRSQAIRDVIRESWIMLTKVSQPRK